MKKKVLTKEYVENAVKEWQEKIKNGEINKNDVKLCYLPGIESESEPFCECGATNRLIEKDIQKLSEDWAKGKYEDVDFKCVINQFIKTGNIQYEFVEHDLTDEQRIDLIRKVMDRLIVNDLKAMEL
ncbi:MAG: hypothetical protein HUJ61_00400 [Bacilli bacterium]|nr:hypothetical protein [Bacilli bacterium]